MTTDVSTIAERALRRLNVAVVPLDDLLNDAYGTLSCPPRPPIATMALVELGVIASDETPIPSDQAPGARQGGLGARGARCARDGLVDRCRHPSGVRGGIHEADQPPTRRPASTRRSDPAALALLEGRVRRGAMVIASHDIAVEAVLAVHTDLVGRGIARWSSQDIPDMAALP